VLAQSFPQHAQEATVPAMQTPQKPAWASVPPPPEDGRVKFHLGRLRRMLALAGTSRAEAEASSDLEQRFQERCRQFDAPSVLELGTKQSIPGRSTMHRDWVPHAAEFLGTDMEEGPDVDIVADVHRLSEHVGRERFDVILSCSTFEHLKYPALAAHEIMKSLKVGGAVYIQTVQSFPLHAFPSDYFRFSQEALASLFGTRMGVEVVATNYDFPVRLYARRVPGLQRFPAFLNSTLWGEKRGPTPDEYVYDL
jgi:Methyltransferase domain